MPRTSKEIDDAIKIAVESAEGITDSRLLFDLYKAELDSARHYENMRTTMTGSLILVTLALTGVAFAKDAPVARWLVGTAMIAVGALSFLMASSITRAFLLHRWNAQHLRRALTRVPSAGPAQSLFRLTRELWSLGRPPLLRARIWISPFWLAVPVALMLIGVVVLALSLCGVVPSASGGWI